MTTIISPARPSTSGIPPGVTTWRLDITIQEAINERWDAVVIGSGMGGLSAAAFLAQAGVRPLVLEEDWQPGGYSQSCRPMRMVHKLLDQLATADQVEFVPPDPTSSRPQSSRIAPFGCPSAGIGIGSA